MMLKTFLHKFGLQDLVIFLAVIPMLHLQLTEFAQDPGVGWHLSTGKLIAESGSVPRVDPFLYSSSPRAWICDQWLSDLLIYKLFALGSWKLLYAFFSAVYLIAYFGFLYPSVAITCGTRLGAGFVCYLAMRAGLIHFILRPVVFGQLFFCALFAVILLFRDKIISTRFLFVCSAVIFLFWSNMHPSFFLGFFLCFCLIVDGLYRRVWLLEENHRLPLTVINGCLLLIVCFLATLLNPNGISLHLSIVDLARSDYFLNYHSEWLAPNFKSLEGRDVQIFLFILCIAPFIKALKSVAQDNKNREIVDSFSVSALLVFGHLGLEMLRVLPHFLVVATVPVARSLASIAEGISLRDFGPIKYLSKKISWIEMREQRGSLGLFSLSLVSLFLIFSAVRLEKIPFYFGIFGPQPRTRAVEIVERLRDVSDKSGEHYVVLADPDFGGVITFYGQGRIKAVIDDRNTMLGEEAYREFNEKFRTPSRGIETLKDYAHSLGANLIMLRKEELLTSLLLEKNAKIVVEDETFIMLKI